MTVKIRIPQTVLETIRKDLSRQHPFAFERVGFLFGSTSKNQGSLIVTLSKYTSISDNNYLPDNFVGASIGSTAIRSAMQLALDNNESVFHIHQHDGFETPWFSRVDLMSLHELIPSFQSISPKNVHGGLVFNNQKISSIVWLPGKAKPQKAQTSIIGFPTQILPIPPGGLYA